MRKSKKSVHYSPLFAHALSDDSVGAKQHRLGNGQVERLCGLQVDDALELSRLFDRQTSGLGAFK